MSENGSGKKPVIRNEKGRFVSGSAPPAGAGRPRGSRNKINQDILDLVAKYGEPYLRRLFKRSLKELNYESARSLLAQVEECRAAGEFPDNDLILNLLAYRPDMPAAKIVAQFLLKQLPTLKQIHVKEDIRAQIEAATSEMTSDQVVKEAIRTLKGFVPPSEM